MYGLHLANTVPPPSLSLSPYLCLSIVEHYV